MGDKNVVGNMAWRFAERCGAQGVALVVSIILARLLSPDDFGLIALVTVISNVLAAFVDGGFNNALIQKRDADELDFSTVFYFNMAVCLLLYAGVFLLAPALAAFYEKPELTLVVRALCATIIISGFKNVQQAYVARNLLFRKFFFATLGGTLASAVVGVALAYAGYGVWALVAQQLVNAAVDALILWISVKWRPKLIFSFARLKELFSYGSRLVAAVLLETVYSNLRQLIIGKLYSPSDLAYYNKGSYYPGAVVGNISAAVDSVLLPVMSSAQDDRQRVKSMTKRAVSVSSYIMWPIMTGLAVLARPLVTLLLTDKWLPCVPFLLIFCLNGAFYPIHLANINAVKALGRSDLILKTELIKKLVGFTALFLTVKSGTIAIALGLMLSEVISTYINAYPSRRLIGYNYIEQLGDIAPSVLLSLAMGAAVYAVSLLGLNDILSLVIQIPLGAGVYILGSRIFKLKSFYYILETIRKTGRRT